MWKHRLTFYWKNQMEEHQLLQEELSPLWTHIQFPGYTTPELKHKN